jgi:PilZ domain
MRENRKHERFDAFLEVEVTWPGHGTAKALTQDLSDGGVRLEPPFKPPPPVGTVLEARLVATTGDGAEPPTLTARVVWVAPDAIGLMFVKDGDGATDPSAA